MEYQDEICPKPPDHVLKKVKQEKSEKAKKKKGSKLIKLFRPRTEINKSIMKISSRNVVATIEEKNGNKTVLSN